jgi:hypothetical protein
MGGTATNQEIVQPHAVDFYFYFYRGFRVAVLLRFWRFTLRLVGGGL